MSYRRNKITHYFLLFLLAITGCKGQTVKPRKTPPVSNSADSSFASGWCSTTDVLSKAFRKHLAGFKVMIDFHYSKWIQVGNETNNGM